MTAEWMPKNPCENCQCGSVTNHCFLTCCQYAGYIGGKSDQRKLLKHQIGLTAGRIPAGIGVTELREMLKQLEKGQ
jgi:hypothetical protein